jgi:hypothetical protein
MERRISGQVRGSRFGLDWANAVVTGLRRGA